MGVHEIEQGGGSSSAKFVEKGEKSTPPGLYSKMRDTLIHYMRNTENKLQLSTITKTVSLARPDFA